MASGEPSPCLMKQIQMAVCQLCGKDMEHSSKEPKVNYQKQIDEPHVPFTQIIPDSRYDELEAYEKRHKGKKNGDTKTAPLQICIPISMTPQQPKCANGEAKSTTKEQTNGKDTENTGTVKAACLPAGGCPPPVKMMLCLPCPPPECSTSGSGSQAQKKQKPRDYTYRCESRELRGGNLYQCCQCIKRNGLQHDCPRTPCQGRPACLTKPWPDCWPSGGCHGIDYSREIGVKRYDPCMEQRFDKKDCRPPGSSPRPNADCAGNMMIVVCPPQPQPPC